MFNTLSTAIDAFCAPQIVMRSSDAIDFICVDVMTKSCTVQYKSGQNFQYNNVSRRAMLNLLKTRTISLGFWVNQNLLNNINIIERRRYVNPAYSA